MIVKVGFSSSFVNGWYALIDLLIVAIFTRFLRNILSCWNVRRIYDDKEELQLRPAPIESFIDYGVSSRGMQHKASIVFSLVVILFLIGDFAIVGVTEDRHEKITVQNLVNFCSSDAGLDFKEHISLDHGLVSGSVLLLMGFTHCVSRSPAGITLYQYFNDLRDLSVPRWSPNNIVLNSTCIIKSENYKDQPILQALTWSPPDDILSDKCKWTKSNAEISRYSATLVTGSQANECLYPVIEAWCLQRNQTFCATASKVPGGFVLSSITGKGTDSLHILLEQRPESRVLKAAVLLTALETFYDRNMPLLWSLLTVEMSGTVERVVGKMSVTNIHVELFCLTVGSALLMFSAIGVWSFVLWLKVIVFANRNSYNSFNSTMDLVSYAATRACMGADPKIRLKSSVVVLLDGQILPLSSSGAGAQAL